VKGVKNTMGRVLEFEAVARIDCDYAVGSCSLFNGLFRINMNTGECSYLRMFPNEKAFVKRLHTKALLYENKIYFIPCAADYISVYDIEKDSITEIELQKIDLKKYPWYLKNNKFNDGIMYQDNVFMIGSTYPAIVKLNLKADSLEYYTQWVKGEVAFRKSPAIVDNQFYVPSIKGNEVLCFDMDTGRGKIHNVGKNNHGCWGICKIQDDLWLSPQEPGAIIRWNISSGNIKEYMSYPEGFDSGGFACTKIYETNGVVGLLPAYANMALVVDIKTGQISQNDMLQKSQGEITYYLFDDGDYTYIKNADDGLVTYDRINISENKKIPFNFYFEHNRESYLDDCLRVENLIKENEIINLTDFIGRIK